MYYSIIYDIVYNSVYILYMIVYSSRLLLAAGIIMAV
jgi:hypothetical protein